MIKKLIVIVLAILMALPLVACGEEEDLFKNYEVAQLSETTTVKYGDKNLDATVIEFANPETPESLYAVFGEIEEGKPDVSFLGRVELIDGNVTVGVHTGVRPRMAGVYVVGFGYFFIEGDIVDGGEYAISIKDVPLGTFSMKPFAIVEDTVILGAEILSFTKNGQVYAEGENNGELFSEIGVFDCANGKYTTLSNSLLAVAKVSVFNTGTVKAKVSGNAGIILGVSGTSVTDVSLASYVYFGVVNGKVCIIEYVNGVESVNAEETISSYDVNKQYEIKVESTGSAVKLILDGTEKFSLDLSIEQGRNIGIKGLTKNSTVSNLSYPETSLATYKEFAMKQFNELVVVDLYKVSLGTDVENSSINRVTVDYSKDSDDQSVKRAYTKAENAINEAEDLATAVAVFEKQYASLNEKVMERYQSEAFSTIADVADKWYRVIDLNGEVSNYDVGEINPIYGIAYDIMIEGTPFVIDPAVHDHRWWIPEPLRIPIIRSSAYRKIFACNNKVMLSVMYEEYYDAILRSVCQKAFEVYYSVRMKTYTDAPGSVANPSPMLWQLLWSYVNEHNSGGTRQGFEFAYNGPVEEYKGKVYGTYGKDELQFKLSSMFYYVDGDDYKANVSEIVAGFKAGIDKISTGA